MTSPLRVLCLDIEGGHGGSSRSLYHILRHVDRTRVAPEVWCRREGAIQDWYAALNIPCSVHPTMPKVSALPKISRNVYVFARAALEFHRSRPFREQLAREIGECFDLVHLNHEALFLLARWLRPRITVPISMHIRTNLWDTPFARWQTRIESTAVDQRIFITDNELATYEGLGGTGGGKVIFNVVNSPETLPEPLAAIPCDDRLRIACLSNYSWMRGLDQLVDVAMALKQQGRTDVLFVMAGDMALTRSLPGELGRLGSKGGTLADYAAQRGVADYFLFLGHVSEPERVLAGCHALVKPTRESNPWGRDILEAMSYGLPVFSVGSYDTFVQTGKTGFLYSEFDPGAMARDAAALAGDRELCARLGEAARRLVARLCDGQARAADLRAAWEQMYVARRG